MHPFTFSRSSFPILTRLLIAVRYDILEWAKNEDERRWPPALKLDGEKPSARKNLQTILSLITAIMTLGQQPISFSLKGNVRSKRKEADGTLKLFKIDSSSWSGDGWVGRWGEESEDQERERRLLYFYACLRSPFSQNWCKIVCLHDHLRQVFLFPLIRKLQRVHTHLVPLILSHEEKVYMVFDESMTCIITKEKINNYPRDRETCICRPWRLFLALFPSFSSWFFPFLSSGPKLQSHRKKREEESISLKPLIYFN